MSFIESYGKELFSLLVPVVTWGLNRFFKAKAQLLLANPHSFTFLVAQPQVDAQGTQIAPRQTVHTRSLMVVNSGKETATKVEWVFNWRPLCLNTWPSRHYTEHLEPDNRYILIFDSLAPGEHIGCEILSVNVELPNLITVRSDQCVARKLDMYPQPVVSRARRQARSVLMFAGLALLVYISIVLAQFLILRTPFSL
jgi:hypothetical protein